MYLNDDFKSICDDYINVVFSINNDLQLWQVFLPATIQTYLDKYPNQTQAQSSGFYTYDINPRDGRIGRLYNFNKSSEIQACQLESSSKSFLEWVKILSIVRLYDAIENLLLQSIQCKYFDNGSLHSRNRKNVNSIKNKIQEVLKENSIPVSRINNKFIIDFIKLKSSFAASFLEYKTYSVEESSWEEFFDFISIIRHIVVHNGMIVSADERNSINSKFKKLFSLYFEIRESESEEDVLRINQETGVVNIISMCNDFALNISKCVFDLEGFKNHE